MVKEADSDTTKWLHSCRCCVEVDLHNMTCRAIATALFTMHVLFPRRPWTVQVLQTVAASIRIGKPLIFAVHRALQDTHILITFLRPGCYIEDLVPMLKQSVSAPPVLAPAERGELHSSLPRILALVERCSELFGNDARQ